MSDSQLEVLTQLHNILNYTSNFLKLAGFLIGLFFYKSLQSKVYKVLVWFLGLEFLNWFLNTLLLFNQTRKGVNEVEYYEPISVILRLSVISYLFLFTLNKSIKIRVVFSSFVLLNFIYSIYDVVKKGNKSILEYISYSNLMADFMVVLMALTYLLTELRKKAIEKISFLNLALLFFSYYIIKIVYTLSTNFILNSALYNNNIFAVMMSKMLFDFPFYALIVFFVLKEIIKNRRQDILLKN